MYFNDCSNVLNGCPTILMHKPPNCFHIFRRWARGRSPWPLVVFEWRSASLEARVPLETPRATHGLISIRTSYHFKSLRSRFAEFHAEFDVCSLLQFHVHAEIANVKTHVVTNTRVVQLPMLTQRRHSAYWLATFPAPKHSARIYILPSVGGLWNKSRNFLIHLCTLYHIIFIRRIKSISCWRKNLRTIASLNYIGFTYEAVIF